MISTFSRHLKNILGFTTQQKIIVFEVDDWGAVAIANNKSYEQFSEKGIIDHQDRFNKYDDLASVQDLSHLFDVLNRHRDIQDQPASFTAFTLVANPDFDNILKDGSYHYEIIDKTFRDRFSSNILPIWEEGISTGVFYPELHGREHVHVKALMKLLHKSENIRSLIASRSIAVLNKDIIGNLDYLKAFDLETLDNIKDQSVIINDSINHFLQLFGYRPTHFTSPGLIHHPELENIMAKEGISLVDVAKKRLIPYGHQKYGKSYNWLGKKNKYHQVYITRNMRFEPSINQDLDWVDLCMKEISTSFLWKKPAIISSHRVNFVSGKSVENRDKSLEKLDQLLDKVLRKWPDVRFMKSVELGAMIQNEK